MLLIDYDISDVSVRKVMEGLAPFVAKGVDVIIYFW